MRSRSVVVVLFLCAAFAVTILVLRSGGAEAAAGVDQAPAEQLEFPITIPPPPGPLALDVVLKDILGRQGERVQKGDWPAAKALLLSQGEAGMAKVKELVAGSDPLVLEFAIDVLADSPSEEAVALLKGLLDRPDPMVRFPAAVALRKHGDWSGVLLMAYELGSSKDVATRRCAAGYLEQAGRFAAPTLVRALADPAWQVRSNALDSLSEVADASVATRIREVMRGDDNWAVRAAAARALYKLTQSDEASESLLTESLKHLPSQSAMERQTAAMLLTDAAKMGRTEALSRLVELLSDSSRGVRRFAIDGLCQFSQSSLGYDCQLDPKQQQESIGRWRSWLQERAPRNGP